MVMRYKNKGMFVCGKKSFAKLALKISLSSLFQIASDGIEATATSKFILQCSKLAFILTLIQTISFEQNKS